MVSGDASRLVLCARGTVTISAWSKSTCSSSCSAIVLPPPSLLLSDINRSRKSKCVSADDSVVDCSDDFRSVASAFKVESALLARAIPVPADLGAYVFPPLIIFHPFPLKVTPRPVKQATALTDLA
ncbi:hypothetical protein Mapa_001978 [Marchantia paleacea]|nr:hypothetical protein Mapa_001978 [Marchantia paleacea]